MMVLRGRVFARNSGFFVFLLSCCMSIVGDLGGIFIFTEDVG